MNHRGFSVKAKQFVEFVLRIDFWSNSSISESPSNCDLVGSLFLSPLKFAGHGESESPSKREREKKIPKPLVVASRRILSSQSLVEVSLPKIQSFCNYKITELSNRNARCARKLVKWILKSDRKASTFWRLAKNENNENWSSNFTNFKRRSAIFLERDLLLETRAAPQPHFVVNLSPYESLSATV